MDGDDRLREVTFRDNASMGSETKEISNVFVMIGASPKTAWLSEEVSRDARGFILTGAQAGSEAIFETSMEGIYQMDFRKIGIVRTYA